MRKIRIVAVLSLCLLTLFVFQGAFAGESVPGSEEDPLVSRSYVDKRLNFEVLNVQEGETLFCSAGTEVILRSGQASAVDSPNGGLADVTSGQDIRQGEGVTANHLIIVPRDDGRGLFALTDIIVMIRGSYSLD